MKQLDEIITIFARSEKPGLSIHLDKLKEIRGEFESLNLSNHTLKLDNNHKQEVIDEIDANLTLEKSRTWWNKLWNTYPKS